MAQQRLPTVNGNDGAWGDILNQFLQKEHYDTGSDNVLNSGHKTITIRPDIIAALTVSLKFTSGSLMTTPEAGAVGLTLGFWAGDIFNRRFGARAVKSYKRRTRKV